MAGGLELADLQGIFQPRHSMFPWLFPKCPPCQLAEQENSRCFPQLRTVAGTLSQALACFPGEAVISQWLSNLSNCISKKDLKRHCWPCRFSVKVSCCVNERPEVTSFLKRTVITSSSPTVAEMPGLSLGPGRQAGVGGSCEGGCWYHRSLLRMRIWAFRVQIHRKSKIH